ncbi:MAG: hypothetical protein ACOVNY_09595 [Chitinophagaceae bacterium]
MTIPVYIAIALCSFMLFFLLWKEVKRPQKKYLFLRIIAIVISVGSLVAMLYEIPYTATDSANKKDTAFIFLTDGYNIDSVQKYMKLNGISDTCSGSLSYQLQLHPNKNAIVMGNGFFQDELLTLKDNNFQFIPSMPSSGITEITWKQLLFKGEKLLISGVYKNNVQTPVTIYLQAFGENVDSVFIAENAISTFQLQAVPKHTGRLVYNILVQKNRQTIASNPIPFQVTMPTIFNVCMFTSAPNFEQKFLKQWLTQNGHAVITKTAVSKQKFATNFSNTSTQVVDLRNIRFLQNFDAFIFDVSTFNSFSKSVKQQVVNQIMQQQKACLIIADTLFSNNNYLNKFFPMQQNTQVPKLVTLLFNQQKKPLQQTYSWQQLFNNSSQINLVKDSADKVYVAMQLFGKGKIVVSTISETFQWMLQGNKEAYHQFWSYLFNSILPSKSTSQVITSPFIAVQNQPIFFQINTTQITSTFSIAQTPVAVQQSAKYPNQYHATHWFSKVGWQQSVVNDSIISYHYIYPKTAFEQVQAMQKIQATKLHCSQNVVSNNSNQSIASTRKKTIPPYVFVTLFFIANAFLWWERKR